MAEIRDRFGTLNTPFLNAGVNTFMPLEARVLLRYRRHG